MSGPNNSFLKQTVNNFLGVDTTSTAAAAAVLLSTSITTQGGTSLVIWITLCASNNTINSSVHSQLQVDGALISNTKSNTRNAANVSGTVGVTWMTGVLAAGAHTVDVMWWSGGGTTIQCRPNTQNEFCEVEIWEVLQ